MWFDNFPFAWDVAFYPCMIQQSMIAKETQLQLAQKELNKLKEQLNNAEVMRARAYLELEQAKKVVEELTEKLRIVNESKESAMKEAESANTHISKCKEINSGADYEDVASWALEREKSREQFSVANAELGSVKQELSRTRRDLEASMEAKSSAALREAEAERMTISSRERMAELTKEAHTVKESVVQVKHALQQVHEEESKIRSEKELSHQDQKLALEAAEKKAASLREELDPEVLNVLKSEVAKVEAEVNAAKKKLEDLKQADMESSAAMVAELDAARETLQLVVKEEISLRASAELLRSELEKIKQEKSELIEKESQTESLVVDLDKKLREAKAELQVAKARQSKVEAARDELISARQQLLSEAEDAKREAEEMQRAAAELRKEVAVTSSALEESEKKLHATLAEAEEAKMAAEVARTSTSEEQPEIKVESEELLEIKMAAAVAQVDAIRTSEREVTRRLEMVRQELKEVNTATEEALKRAQMADAARSVLEAELKRWHEREKKEAESHLSPSEFSHAIRGSRSSYHPSGEQQ